jgi:hypothetical protein
MDKGGGGTIGVINAMRGADVMIGQTKLVSTVALQLFRPMVQVAGRVSGQFKGAIRRLRTGVPPEPTIGPMSEKLVQTLEEVEGIATHEGRGTASGLSEYMKAKGANSIDLVLRRIASEKRAGRVAALREFGEFIYQKGTTILDKTPSSGVGRFVSGYLKKINGKLTRVETVDLFVPDIDIAWVKVDGRFLNDEEVLELCKYLNKGVRETWAKEGRAGVPSRPYRHGALQNLPEHFGDTAPGTLKRYDNHYFNLCGGPKGCFSLSLSRGGNVVYQVVPTSTVRQFVYDIFGQHWSDIFGPDPALRTKWLEELDSPF